MQSQKLQSLSSNEYLGDPSLRTVSAYALGTLLLLSINYIIKSPALQFLFNSFNLLFNFSSSSSKQTPESIEEDSQEKVRLRQWIEETFLGPSENMDPKNLVLTLTIFAFNASLGMFGSTLVYSSGQDVLCTFSVAWGRLSGQMIRIVGFVRLSLDLRELGARQWEMYLTWFYVLGLAALMMVTTVFEPAVLRTYQQLQGLAFCYTQHYLPIDVLSSLLNSLFELYAIIRFIFLLVPSFLRFRHKIHAVKDIRLGKALALLVLDLLTAVPSARPISIAADYIPFVVGTIIVLMAFNYEQARVVKTLSRVDSIPSTRMIRIFQGGSTPTLPRSPNSTRRSSMAVSRHSSHPHRRNPVSPVPSFSLAKVSAEVPKQKGLKELDIVSANAPSNAGSSTQRKAYNSGVTGYTIPTPKRSSGMSADRGKRQSNQSVSIESYSEFPLPPKNLPPVPIVQITPVEDEHGRRYKVAPFPRRDVSPTSSIVYGSDIVHTKRAYDPTKDLPDNPSSIRHHRSLISPNISPNSSQERWSNPWPPKDENLSTVAEDNESLYEYSIARRSRGTFGARSKRASKHRLARVDSKRRSSIDTGTLMPYVIDDTRPPSPTSAPVSRQAITPVDTAPVALSPGLLDPGGKRAVATGKSDPMTSPRIRFGARPMRSAIVQEGFRGESPLPRLLEQKSVRQFSVDKMQ